MNKIQFIGRPDGLCNRIEELINLKCLKNKFNINFTYYWNNFSAQKDRRYEILLDCGEGIELKPFDGFNSPSLEKQTNITKKYFHTFTQEEYFLASKDIKFIDYKNLIQKKLLGIHVRRGDKIKKNPSISEMTNEESNEIITKAIEYANKKNQDIFLCGDDPKYIDYIKNNLNKDIVVYETEKKNYNLEYHDLYNLAQCSEICMCSKVSSYSIISSLLGNSKLIYFKQPHDDYEKYIIFRNKPNATLIK